MICTCFFFPFFVVVFCVKNCSANNFALKAKRKTLSANDVLSALEDMEFEHFVPELKECLEGKWLCLSEEVCAAINSYIGLLAR